MRTLVAGSGEGLSLPPPPHPLTRQTPLPSSLSLYFPRNFTSSLWLCCQCRTVAVFTLQAFKVHSQLFLNVTHRSFWYELIPIRPPVPLCLEFACSPHVFIGFLHFLYSRVLPQSYSLVHWWFEIACRCKCVNVSPVIDWQSIPFYSFW